MPGKHSSAMDEEQIPIEKGAEARPGEEENAKGKTGAEPEKTASFGNYFRILGYATGKDRIILAMALICSIASGAPLPIMTIVFGNLVGEFNGYFTPGTSVTEAAFKSSVSQLSLYIVYLFIAKFCLTYISMLCFRVVGLRISAGLRLDYIQSLFAQPISKLDEVSTGTVTNTVTTLSNTIQQSVSEKLGVLFQSLALVVAAYIIAFKYSWALTLATSSAILFIVISLSLLIPISVKIQQRVDKADEKHSSIAAEAFGCIRTVFSLGAQGALSGKYSSWVKESEKRGRSQSPIIGGYLSILFFAMYASSALTFWFGLKLFREGHIDKINAVIVVFFSITIVVGVMGGIASPFMIISKAVSASGAFFEILDSQKVDAGGLSDPDVSAHVDITFQDVHFTYPTRPDAPILKGLAAQFQKGKTTALVGPSGSGKSTIISLVERWYQLAMSPIAEDSNQGSILVGEHNINSLDLKWWRTQIGIVQQEPFLFNDTIFNNISLGLTGTKWDTESDEVKRGLVEKACREAFAEEFIKRLPEGYETIVGEGGIRLSGGQRQRLAIARSIVKEPPILILDEATSAIDVRGEKIVQAALDRVSKDRTTIMIAHRLSTVRRADRIIVMQDGVAVEQGTHDELLLVEDGIYRGLVVSQRIEHLERQETELDEAADEPTEVEHFDKSSEKEEEKDMDVYKSRGFFGSLGRLIYEQRTHWMLYIAILVSAAGAGSGYALQSWLFANLIEAFRFTGQKLIDAANFWALIFFILAIGMGICYATLGFFSNAVSVKISSAYREEYFQNILKKPIPFYDLNENSSGSLSSQLGTDTKQVQELLGPSGAFPLISVFNMIGCIAIAFSFGWKLSLVAVFAAMPAIFLGAFMRIRYEIQFESMNAQVYGNSSQFAAEAIGAFRTVSALAMEDKIVNRYQTLLEQQQHKAFRKSWYAMLIFAFSDSVELCAMALTFWYGGQLLASREYEPTSFFVIYMAIIQSGQSAGQFFSYGSNIAQATASANRILASRLSNTADIKGEEVVCPRDGSGASVEFRDVAFKYPSRDVPLFTGLNVDIKSGQFVAFVGPSGCGKSTLISLLERFYDPAQGTILFNGQDINSLEVLSYRKLLSLVAQEPKMFEGSIHENITLGLDDGDYTEEEFIQACKDSKIHDFIISLPEGYSTQLGVNAQVSLSGGQRQRLCIARALLRKPSLLLLDEATSSLDSQSERFVQAALERVAGTRSLTTIAVAHRLATIQQADAIFVFSESRAGGMSRIIERGTHQELLQLKGTYWQMCQAQALEK